MRVAIGHRKTRREAIEIVDQSFDDLFRGLPIALLQITEQHRSWNGSVMTFGLTAKIGFLQNPIRGTVEVTDREITIDADLGLLEKLISQGKFKTAIQGTFQKLLPG
ncbi:MAG: hypothetical protein JWO80_1399 [Bryobacterales bacterium]|nr:hypothetical protein [Bryobacterales bacterium]